MRISTPLIAIYGLIAASELFAIPVPGEGSLKPGKALLGGKNPNKPPPKTTPAVNTKTSPPIKSVSPTKPPVVPSKSAQPVSRSTALSSALLTGKVSVGSSSRLNSGAQSSSLSRSLSASSVTSVTSSQWTGSSSTSAGGAIGSGSASRPAAASFASTSSTVVASSIPGPSASSEAQSTSVSQLLSASSFTSATASQSTGSQLSASGEASGSGSASRSAAASSASASSTAVASSIPGPSACPAGAKHGGPAAGVRRNLDLAEKDIPFTSHAPATDASSAKEKGEDLWKQLDSLTAVDTPKEQTTDRYAESYKAEVKVVGTDNNVGTQIVALFTTVKNTVLKPTPLKIPLLDEMPKSFTEMTIPGKDAGNDAYDNLFAAGMIVAAHNYKDQDSVAREKQVNWNVVAFEQYKAFKGADAPTDLRFVMRFTSITKGRLGGHRVDEMACGREGCGKDAVLTLLGTDKGKGAAFILIDYNGTLRGKEDRRHLYEAPGGALPPNVRFEPVDPEKELMNLEPKAFEMAWCTRAKFWFTLVLFMSVQCLHC
ncbi:hypothetical protein C8J57DRAFT_1710468 [Mycena rebaudengoi]|nr:hypothetical protein C8J57DRAFT_1710468 [Mycena rebaudengoi]